MLSFLLNIIKNSSFFYRMGQFLKYSLWDCFIDCSPQVLSQHQIAESLIPVYLDIELALVAGMRHQPDCPVEYF